MDQEQLVANAPPDEARSPANQPRTPPFLIIPPEIRLIIYQLIVPHLRVMIGKHGNGFNLSGQILRVCRQVYPELLRVIYGSTTFILGPSGLSRDVVEEFFDRIGPKSRQCISHLVTVSQDLPDFDYFLQQDRFRDMFRGIQKLQISFPATKDMPLKLNSTVLKTLHGYMKSPTNALECLEFAFEEDSLSNEVRMIEYMMDYHVKRGVGYIYCDERNKISSYEFYNPGYDLTTHQSRVHNVRLQAGRLGRSAGDVEVDVASELAKLIEYRSAEAEA